MASSGGFDVTSIAINMKRKLQAEGGQGIDIEASKKPKIFEVVEAEAEVPDDLEALLGDDEFSLPGEDDMEAILKLVEEAPEVQQLDVQTVRSLILRFEKALNLNVQMRSKFSDQPEKFMDSEVGLDEAISAMQLISASPELYGELVDLNVIPSLLSLVPHENADIGIAVVVLLHDLLDSDELTGAAEDITNKLVASLMSNNGPAVLVNNLARYNEKQTEDAQAVHNTLAIFENLAEVNEELVVTLCQETKLLKYLCLRISKDGFDNNKLYASEMLSILMQTGNKKVRRSVGEGSSPQLITILKVIAKYRRRDPNGPEETEFLENLFNAVCFALHENKENQLRFAKAEGLELMIAVLRKKKYAKHGAIKAIDFALQKCQSNCEKFIDVGGLKVLFALFMKRAKKKDKAFETGTEEHVVSCLSQLFLNLSDVRYFRMLRKFQENDMSKVERLIELQEKYASRLESAEAKYRKEHPLHLRRKQAADEDGIGKEDEYMRRVDAGLFTLQGVDLLIGLVATAGERRLLKRVKQLLTQLDSDLDNVKKILVGYAEKVGDDGDEEGDDEETKEANKKLKIVLDAIISML